MQNRLSGCFAWLMSSAPNPLHPPKPFLESAPHQALNMLVSSWIYMRRPIFSCTEQQSLIEMQPLHRDGRLRWRHPPGDGELVTRWAPLTCSSWFPEVSSRPFSIFKPGAFEWMKKLIKNASGLRNDFSQFWLKYFSYKVEISRGNGKKNPTTKRK